MELVSFTDLKNFLGLEGTLITEYPALNIIQSSVEYAVDNYLGRFLESIERSDTFYITGPTNIISLPAIPVATVSSLVVTMLNEDETYEQDSDDFITVKAGLELSVELNNAKIAITYTGGLSAVPDDINRAALYQTVYEYMGKDQVGAETVKTQGGSVTRPATSLLPVTKDLLRKHMHPYKLTDK